MVFRVMVLENGVRVLRFKGFIGSVHHPDEHQLKILVELQSKIYGLWCLGGVARFEGGQSGGSERGRCREMGKQNIDK